MAYNRWVQGIASREISSTPAPMRDLFDKKKAQSMGDAKTPKMIHPTLDKTPEIVGNALLALSNLKQKTNEALQSNLSQDPKKKQVLINILNLTKQNLNMLSRTIKELEKI